MWAPIDALELLAELNDLGFPDSMFRRIHPHGHSMAKYGNYCRKRERRFTSISSSQVLCERMHAIVTAARTSETRDLNGARWATLVDEAIAQSELANPGFGRLDAPHQRFVAEQIARLVEVAIDRRHPMRWVAEWQARNTLWRWTVDGVAANGTVVVDAAKADVMMWPITTRALVSTAKRIHEHVVPRVVITRRLIRERVTDVSEIETCLRQYCVAAVVTDDEDDLLDQRGLREAMPDGWQWGDDPWARYRTVGLYDALQWPRDWPSCAPAREGSTTSA